MLAFVGVLGETRSVFVGNFLIGNCCCIGVGCGIMGGSMGEFYGDDEGSSVS